MIGMGSRLQPMWKCPECGARFVTANTWHSCGRYSLKALFAKSEPNVRRIFRKFARMVRACGPVTMVPQKTRMVFMTRVRFVAVYPRKRSMEVGIELAHRRPDPRFYKIESYSRHMHGHHLRIANEKQLDGRLQRWLRESYIVGEQKVPRAPQRRLKKAR
jgi:hypothetical protein